MMNNALKHCIDDFVASLGKDSGVVEEIACILGLSGRVDDEVIAVAKDKIVSLMSFGFVCRLNIGSRLSGSGMDSVPGGNEGRKES